MSDDSTSSTLTVYLRQLIERLPDDPAALQQLIECAYERLHAQAKRIFNLEFPRLVGIHKSTSIAHHVILRLMRTLETIQPESVAGFFSIAAKHCRWTLLDLSNKHDKRKERASVASSADESGQSFSPVDPEGTIDDPAQSAIWTEFHETVDKLPQQEKEVADLYIYQGFTQAEIGEILGLHPKKVSLLWLRARRKLPDVLPEK